MTSSTRLVDSNLYDIVNTAINSFHANMRRLRGTKPDTMLLETEAEELFMLMQIITQQMSLKITAQYQLGSRNWNLAIQELEKLAGRMSDAIDQYQQQELALIRNNFFDSNRQR